MRVVQFLASPGWGGLENVFVNLCNELSKMIEIDVIVLQNSAVIEKFDKNIRVHVLTRSPSRYNPLLYMELYRLLHKLKPDIMHTHSAKATQIFYYLNMLLDFPHVATKHNSRKGKVFNKLFHVIAVSKGVKESIKNHNVKIIYNGIKPVEILPQNKDEIFTILAVGRLDNIKGFDILIKECAKLNFAFRLHIIGEGKERVNLEKMIVELALEDKVQLLGFRNDIPQLMKNAEMVVMSSHSEGFSLVMLESIFYGNLFVSTKVSGATEVLDERFLFDGLNLSDKLNDVYRNYMIYKEEYVNLTNELQKKFLLENIAKEHIIYYESIVNSKTLGNH